MLSRLYNVDTILFWLLFTHPYPWRNNPFLAKNKSVWYNDDYDDVKFHSICFSFWEVYISSEVVYKRKIKIKQQNFFHWMVCKQRSFPINWLEVCFVCLAEITCSLDNMILLEKIVSKKNVLRKLQINLFCVPLYKLSQFPFSACPNWMENFLNSTILLSWCEMFLILWHKYGDDSGLN